mmetsp:Transcript_125455/g.360544  ORF Transcript_125455/g.360544 Transcript_125455/m.360544 type:complete len:221 (+) Transcript_125455:513-1175(+)
MLLWHRRVFQRAEQADRLRGAYVQHALRVRLVCTHATAMVIPVEHLQQDRAGLVLVRRVWHGGLLGGALLPRQNGHHYEVEQSQVPLRFERADADQPPDAGHLVLLALRHEYPDDLVANAGGGRGDRRARWRPTSIVVLRHLRRHLRRLHRAAHDPVSSRLSAAVFGLRPSRLRRLQLGFARLHRGHPCWCPGGRRWHRRGLRAPGAGALPAVQPELDTV